MKRRGSLYVWQWQGNPLRFNSVNVTTSSIRSLRFRVNEANGFSPAF
ncbi:hypothetical protein B4113_0230 [Geobacillus sp. B4113_201601]|nr:hypothetical protein B4113_0230 [Geobacillus sp. B4113_201601]